RRGTRERREEPVHAGHAGILALRAGAALHSHDAVPAPGRGGIVQLVEKSGMSAPLTQAMPLVESGDASFSRPVTGELDATHGVVLYLESISVSFDGFKALNNLSLSIDIGELRCVIGPNGAGKTTMMDVVTGKTRPDAGTAFFGQTIDLTRLSEAEIAHAGIGRKFQKPTIF